MQGRKNLLNTPKERPRLSDGEMKNHRLKQRKKLTVWYRIYLSTTLAVVLLTVIFLAVNLSGPTPHFGSSLTDRFASFILRSSFRDLSGGIINAEEDEEETILDDLLPINPSPISPENKEDHPPSSAPGTTAPNDPLESIYAFDYSKVPDGEKAILPMDLSLTQYGNTYIHNSTGYSPDTEALLAAELRSGYTPIQLTTAAQPKVLIVHTHGTEGYSENGAISYVEGSSDHARSTDISKNVVSVGETLAAVLSKQGIPTLHCTIMHDSIQYKDSYARAEETIKEYLQKYPSIQLVIDLHRDAVVKSSGELVRPVAEIDSKPTAQVMCVVGSDWGGESCPNWEGNLSLALKLRAALNAKYQNLCRPTYLRPSTYNQELAPFSLLLEIGASGNSLEEAKLAALLVGYELAPLINSI